MKTMKTRRMSWRMGGQSQAQAETPALEVPRMPLSYGDESFNEEEVACVEEVPVGSEIEARRQ